MHRTPSTCWWNVRRLPSSSIQSRANATTRAPSRSANQCFAISLDPKPDAILWVKLVRKDAVIDKGIAYWDGVVQNAITLGPAKPEPRSFFVSFFRNDVDYNRAGSATIEALSVETTLVDAVGTELYRSRGGFQLMQWFAPREPGPKKIFDLTRMQILNRKGRDQGAVHAALRDLVLTPEALAAELNPPADAAKP